MHLPENILYERLNKHSPDFQSVVDYNNAADKIVAFDFTENNQDLKHIDVDNTDEFSSYINHLLTQADAKFGFGGYNELRSFYSRSKLFDSNHNDSDEPRRLHLGIDIWGKPGSNVRAPLNGIVHSFAFNEDFGDYGATIILQHQLEDVTFFTLYGHLALKNLKNLTEGKIITMGEQFAHFGEPKENGHWPPHLHFQVINDIGDYKGDYPGVCKYSERDVYLRNCPDADLILQMHSKAFRYR